jgi:hypothetical protein
LNSEKSLAHTGRCPVELKQVHAHLQLTPVACRVRKQMQEIPAN